TLEDLPHELRHPGRRGPRHRVLATAIAPDAAALNGGAGGELSGAESRFAQPSAGRSTASSWTTPDSRGAPGEDWNAEFAAYERQRLVDALDEAQGNKSVAARLLMMPRSTFCSKLKKHGIA